MDGWLCNHTSSETGLYILRSLCFGFKADIPFHSLANQCKLIFESRSCLPFKELVRDYFFGIFSIEQAVVNGSVWVLIIE